ncbi:MAG: hypothetical protein QM702_25165 [Rubrivivax sp.]
MAAWDQDLDTAPRAAWEQDLDNSPADQQRTAVRTVAYGAAANPDMSASAVRLARETGLPFDMAQRNAEEVRRRAAAARIDADTTAATVLRQKYTDPAFAAVAIDDSAALARVEKAGGYTFGQAFRKGIAGAKLTWDLAADQLARAAGADRTQTQQILQQTAAYYRAQGSDQQLTAAGERAKAAGGGTWYGTLAHLPGEIAASDDPFGIAGRFITEQLLTSIAGFGLGAAATAPVRAAVVQRISSQLVARGVNASIAGAAGNSTAVVLQSLGANYEEGRQQGLDERAAASRAWTKTTAEVPANAIAGALIGLRIGPNQLTNLAGQTVVQGAAGGIGAAQASQSVGEAPDPVEIALEILGQGISAGPELAGITLTRIRGSEAVRRANLADAAKADADQLTEQVRAANASALRRRDPQTFAEFVHELQPDATVYVAPEHLARLDLSAVPAISERVRDALTDGGDVAVPLADLLAHLPGEQLLPHLRTTPEAMTLAEAQSFDGAAELNAEMSRPAPAVEGSMFTSPEQAGMSADAWAAYQQQAAAAAQAAVEQRDARSQRDLQWLANRTDQALAGLRRQAEEMRGKLADEVLTEVRQQPAYAAMRWLKTGTLPDGTQTVGAKLNTQALREVFGDRPAAPWRYLPTNMLAAGDLAHGAGLHPDVVAEMFGFTSGEEMVHAMLATQPEADAVAARVEQRMLEEHPEIADEIALKRSAEALLADRARTRFLATEAAALAEAVGNRVLLSQEARRYAEKTVAARTVREARPAQYKAAAGRAGRNADEAFRKGDTALAAKWKQSQVLQSALQDEATAARTEVDQALRQFQRIASAKLDGNRDAALANLARSVLQQFGLARADKTAAEYLAQVERYDPELHADLQLLVQDLPAPQADHKALTVADFRTLRDRVLAIWSLARSSREIEVDGQRVAIDDAAAALAEQLAFEPAAKRKQMVGTNERLDLRFRLAGMRAALRRVEAWADARDRGDKAGPFRRIIWQPISDAVVRYRSDRARYVGRFLQLLKPIEPTLKPGKIAAPELGTVFADRSALLHALLHTGNESNLRKLLLGYHWAELREDGTLNTSRWDAFLRRMHDDGRITAADWKFVQGVWDLLEEMKPAAQEAHKRMFGSYFAEITADPVQTPFGEMRGGYVPAMTDSLLVPESRTHGAMDDMLAGQNSPMFPAVNRGFTKARIEDYTRPLALDLRLLPAHIDRVSRFAHLGPVLRDTARLVQRNRAFRSAMDAVDPTAVESMLVPWLKRVAAQSLTKPPESQADRAVARIANTLRNRTGLILMAGNLVNATQQLTGLSVAALRVPARDLAGGLFELVHRPGATARAIAELSPWMAQRTDESMRDVERTIDRLLTNPSARQRAEEFGNQYGMVLQQATDNFVSRIVWLGAYRQAQRAGVDGVQAVRDADSAVRMTQGSFAPEDAAKVEHAGAFTRLFLQFASFFNAQGNLLATEVQNATHLSTAGAQAQRLALVYLLGFAVPAVVADAIGKGMRGELGDDEGDDELAARMLDVLFLSQARYALAMVPVAGQVGNAAIGQFTPNRLDDRIGASPAISALEATVRAPRSIYRAATGEGNPRAAVRDGLTAVGVLTGLPTGPLVRPLGYLADDKADEVTLRGLVTGRDPEAAR